MNISCPTPVALNLAAQLIHAALNRAVLVAALAHDGDLVLGAVVVGHAGERFQLAVAPAFNALVPVAEHREEDEGDRHVGLHRDLEDDVLAPEEHPVPAALAAVPQHAAHTRLLRGPRAAPAAHPARARAGPAR